MDAQRHPVAHQFPQSVDNPFLGPLLVRLAGNVAAVGRHYQNVGSAHIGGVIDERAAVRQRLLKNLLVIGGQRYQAMNADGVQTMPLSMAL